MSLRLHNTLTRTKQDFVPIDANNVRMYVCGPTVYDFAHIGNARPLIVFDVLFRLLRHLYGEKHVTYVRNITDVDDKINARAAEQGISIRELTDRTRDQFHVDVDALGCLRPTKEPRATDHIDGMKDLIERLHDRKFAYVERDNVLFDVSRFADYGALSNRSLDEMIAGARVEVAPYKHNPMDFVLWKPSDTRKSNVPLPSWKSPLGIETGGRPGWHIECSAMSEAFLGEHFDIHGGGIDLIFPHHENEIAQSRCAHGTSAMANYWLHNGFLQVEGEKMSKSAGNFVTIRELTQVGWNQSRPWSGHVVRFAMLMTHYRQPIDWTLDRLGAAWDLLDSIRKVVPAEMNYRTNGSPDAASIRGGVPSRQVVDLLMDDLNTPAVRVYFNALLEEARQSTAAGRAAAAQLVTDCLFLGVDPFKAFEDEEAAFDRPLVDTLIEARAAARKAKNFAEADRIRAELDAMGIALKDAKDPATGELVTTWEVKR